MYNTYRFKDKDPVIDVLRTALQHDADSRGVKFSKAAADAAHSSGVSVNTLHNWFFGSTMRPQHASVAAVANALRFSWQLGKVKYDGKPNFQRVPKGTGQEKHS